MAPWTYRASDKSVSGRKVSASASFEQTSCVPFHTSQESVSEGIVDESAGVRVTQIQELSPERTLEQQFESDPRGYF